MVFFVSRKSQRKKGMGDGEKVEKKKKEEG